MKIVISFMFMAEPILLMVVEGQSHADYMVAAQVPESIAVFKDIDMFFTHHLK